MLRAAPFAGERSVVNIVGNGEDNVGEDAEVARDRTVDAGAIVNGVVLGGDPVVLDYYRRQVVGGPGAFVMSTGAPATMANVMARKFLYDIVMNTRLSPGSPALAQQ
jgi:Ca-activated chloride channel homolog